MTVETGNPKVLLMVEKSSDHWDINPIKTGCAGSQGDHYCKIMANPNFG